MDPEHPRDATFEPGFLESFPADVREDVRRSLEKLQRDTHRLAEQAASMTHEFTAETVREAATLPENEREARFDVLTAVNLIAESLHACARFDPERAHELGEAAERYHRQAKEHDA